MTKAWMLSNRLKEVEKEEKEKELKKQEALEKIFNQDEPKSVETGGASADHNTNEPLTENLEVEKDDGAEGKTSFFPEGLEVDTKAENPFVEFEKIDEFYRNKKSNNEATEIKLEKIEAPSETEEDVKNAAKAKLDKKYNDLKNDEAEKFERGVKTADQKRESAKIEAAAAEEKINAVYDSNIKSAENQALKRGLVRSSIIIGQLENIDSNRAMELSNLATNLAKGLTDIDNEINDYKLKQENALAALDIDYAAELSEEIAASIEKLQEKKKEVVEFNNKVEKTEAEYNLSKQKQETQSEIDLAQLKQKYGISIGEEDEQKTAKLEYALEYFNNMSRTQALRKLASDNMFAYYLGDLWKTVYEKQLLRPIE